MKKGVNIYPNEVRRIAYAIGENEDIKDVANNLWKAVVNGCKWFVDWARNKENPTGKIREGVRSFLLMPNKTVFWYSQELSDSYSNTDFLPFLLPHLFFLKMWATFLTIFIYVIFN